MKLRRRRRVKAFPQKRSQLCVGVGFCPQLGGVGPCPAQCIWQGSGFAADQTNAMLAAVRAEAIEAPVKGNLCAYWEAAGLARAGARAIFRSETSFAGSSAGALLGEVIFSPVLAALFRHFLCGGWYHYPRRALHAVETLDARGSRRTYSPWLMPPQCSPCACTRISPRRVHTPPLPRTAHTAAHRGKHGAFSLPETSAGSIGSTA